VNRLVIRAPNWLGDAVMALPAMGAVRAAFPDAHLAVAAVRSIAPIFEQETSAGQDSVLTLPDSASEPAGVSEPAGASEIAALAAGGFEAVVLLPNSFRSAWSARRAAIPERWGYAAGLRRGLLTRAVPRPRARVHQSTYYVELIKGLGLADGDPWPRIGVRAATLVRADAVLSAHGLAPGTRIVGFAPGAAYGHAKRWPPPLVAETIVRLSREASAVCVLLGAAGDRDSGREIESSLPSDVRIVNLIGRTDLRLLVGAMSRCAAFVSNDSGAMHLAAALGVPVAAMFGPTDERATAPLGARGRDGAIVTPDVLTHAVFCRPCMLRDCPIDHRCMKGITVDSVVTAVTARLSRAPASPAGRREEVVT
jgi:heptosyltransferase-2